MFLYRDDDLELRLLERRHAQALFDLIDGNREHISQWLNFPSVTRSVDDTRAYIDGTMRAFSEGRSAGAFGIWHRNQLAGDIGVHEIDRFSMKTELGYWLAADQQGKGLMTQAVRAVVDHLFRDWDLHRIEIHCAPGNTRSRRIPERLGFQEEAVLREAIKVGDGYADRVVYGMLAQEWAAS